MFALALIFSACQKADNLVIDSSQPINAELTSFDRDSVDIAQYIGSQSLTIGDDFVVKLSSVEGFGHLDAMVLNDSGTTLADVSFPTASGDLVSGTITISSSGVYVGDLAYTFTAYNVRGNAGNPTTKFVRLFNSKNHAPVVDSVQAPDSVSVDTLLTALIDIYAFVHDADGLNDIVKAYFNSTRPNGQLSNGNPFIMYDDGGASGAGGDADQVAHDGIYTLQIQLPPGTTTGTYKFTFFAVDRSGVSSSPLSINLKVYQ